MSCRGFEEVSLSVVDTIFKEDTKVGFLDKVKEIPKNLGSLVRLEFEVLLAI